jgi:hypothetical protein
LPISDFDLNNSVRLIPIIVSDAQQEAMSTRASEGSWFIALVGQNSGHRRAGNGWNVPPLSTKSGTRSFDISTEAGAPSPSSYLLFNCPFSLGINTKPLRNK